MAVKTIVEVDVDKDGNFKKFKDLFDDYRARLAETPSEWAAVDEQVKGAAQAHETIFAAIGAQTEALRKLINTQDDNTLKVERSATAWERIAKWTKQTASNIFETTRSLMKWSLISTAITGVLGGGSLWGLDRLADWAGSSRRSAQGLGVSIGQERAFEIQASRLGLGRDFLSSTSGLLTDLQGQIALRQLGVSQKTISSGDTFEAAIQELRGLKHLADTVPQQQYKQQIEARQLGSVANPELLRQLHGMSPKELEQIIANIRGTASKLNLSDDAAKAWQNLSVKLEESWTKIENSFVKGLTGLTPGIEKLSDVVSGFISDLLSSPQLKEWIGGLGKHIKEFADYLGSDAFKEELRKFYEGVKAIAEYLKGWVEYLGSSDNKPEAGAVPPGIPPEKPAEKKDEPPWWVPWGLSPKDWGFGGEDTPQNKPPAPPGSQGPQVVPRSGFNPAAYVIGDERGETKTEKTTYLLRAQLDDLDKIFGALRVIGNLILSSGGIFGSGGAADFTASSARTSRGGASGGGTAPASAGEGANVLERAGLSRNASAGILGWLTEESGLNPFAYNPNDNGSPSLGIGQWHASRLKNLLAFLRAKGVAAPTKEELAHGGKGASAERRQQLLEAELEFLAQELKTSEARGLRGVEEAGRKGGPGAAARAAVSLIGRPAKWVEQRDWARATGFAEDVAKHVGGASGDAPRPAHSGHERPPVPQHKPPPPPAPHRVVVTVTNNTGGNAVTSIAQMPA